MEAQKHTVIPLTGRAPVRISLEDWPRIASAETFSGAHECQANTIAWIRVRQHADGRVLVYGGRDSGPGGWPLGAMPWRGGELVAAGGDIVAAIERLQDGLSGGYCSIDAAALVREAIADLPAEDLS